MTKVFNFLGALFKTIFFFVLVMLVLSLISLIQEHENPKGNIAVVEVAQEIDDAFEVVNEIKKYKEDDHVKAIILRVDSPGGAVGASQEIYDEVIETKKTKPVIASFGNVAASGGYYIAASATKIVSNPGTLTGSIGVITAFFRVDELLKKFNLKWEVIKSGEHKDIGSPLRPMSEKEKQLLQATIGDVYEQFVLAVAEGRNLEVEKVKEFADGRIFSGRKAKELGLVDELGGLEKAIDVAVAEAKLSGEPDVIYPSEKKYKFWDGLAQGKVSLPSLFKLQYSWVP